MLRDFGLIDDLGRSAESSHSLTARLAIFARTCSPSDCLVMISAAGTRLEPVIALAMVRVRAASYDAAHQSRLPSVFLCREKP
jgi:hypothetical protein